MRATASLLLASGFFLLAGCSKNEPSASSGAAEAPIDACALLTAEEVQSVVGEPVQQTAPSHEERDGFTISRCEYSVATQPSAVVLKITQASAARKGELKKQWDQQFPKGNDPSAREVYGKVGPAFWSESANGGVLHILKDNRHVEIGVTMPGDTNSKIDRAEALAEFVSKRL